MFIIDDIYDAYFESYYGRSCWDTGDLTYLVWTELKEVWWSLHPTRSSSGQ